MRTVHVTDALSAYVDGELNEGERAQVERHLETCEECRRHFTALRDLVTLVRSSESIGAPEGFRAQVRARIDQMGAHSPATRRWAVMPLPWRVIGAAAAVAIIGIFAINLLRTQGPVAMREMDTPSDSQAVTEDRMKSGAARMNAETPSSPEIAQRTIPRQRSVARRVALTALPILTLGALAWIAIRRRRLRRAW